MDNNDMGPFAWLDRATIDALTRYGTPPCRESVSVNVDNVVHWHFDDLPTTVASWLQWLEEVRTGVPAEHQADLRCELKWDGGYNGDPGDAALTIWYTRPETDAEMTDRVNRGLKSLKEQNDAERRQFEILRAKFT